MATAVVAERARKWRLLYFDMEDSGMVAPRLDDMRM
jgi:hypothetical protein